MADKPVDRYRQEHEHRRQAYMSAPALREQFPHVEQIVLELAFTDQGGLNSYSAQVHTFSPAATAYFEFPCPSSVCTGGGFDLSRVVSSLIARGGKETSGRLDCQGQQSYDYRDMHRSLLQLEYRLSVAYRR